jgi:hypothetical protein
MCIAKICSARRSTGDISATTIVRMPAPKIQAFQTGAARPGFGLDLRAARQRIA